MPPLHPSGERTVCAPDGTHIGVREFGRGNRPVLLIPGWDNTDADFGALVALLVAEGRRCIWIDPRGTGASDHPQKRWTMRDNVADVCAVLDALGIERCDVVGYSYGGMIAQQLAAAASDRVRRLVLVDTAPPPPLWPPTLTGLRQVTASPAPAATHGPASDHRRIVLALATGRRSALRHVRAPTTVVHGTADQILPLRNGRILARRIRGARLVPIPGGTHDIFAHRIPSALAEAAVVRALSGRVLPGT